MFLKTSLIASLAVAGTMAIPAPLIETIPSNPATPIAKRTVVSTVHLPTPTAAIDANIKLSGTDIVMYGKGFGYTSDDTTRLAQNLKKRCKVDSWDYVYGDSRSPRLQSAGWDFSGKGHFRKGLNLDCVNRVVSEVGGPWLDFKRMPVTKCTTSWRWYVDHFEIEGSGWDEERLNKDGVEGKGLHDEIKGCTGTLGLWKYDTDVDGWAFKASGFVTVFQKECIEHAMLSAGSPSGICDGTT